MSCSAPAIKVTVLEARDRIGGRSWTIRGGDRIVQTGRPDQRASFDPGLYFNAGAGAHPVHAPRDPRLCAQLRRADEPFVNVNRNAGWDFGGKVQPERRMVNDMRGHLGELLAKAIDQPCARPGRAEGRARRRSASSSRPTRRLDDKGDYTPDRVARASLTMAAAMPRPRWPLARLPFKELLP